MRCNTCEAYGASDDNFCRRCGEILQPAIPNLRLPVKRPVSQPPALWQQTAPVVIRAAALVAAGVAAEWLISSATRKALSLPFDHRKEPRKIEQRAPQRREQLANRTLAVSETLLVRRLILRR